MAEEKSKAEAQRKAMTQLRDEYSLLNETHLRDEYTKRRLDEDLRRALQLQEGLDSDLRDLRARYTGLLEIKDKQTQLLRKLTPKLQLASRELQALYVEKPSKRKGSVGSTAKLLSDKGLAATERPGGGKRRAARKIGA
ncbi:hypothetical protein GCM10011617_00170 [Novosphingobium arvoryzae]|uniref:Uncharacterized protein n=1 Tax=Novosphingobium arvoryzae TaxID=1256514 RepID=A0A918R565_9SPHN|nr:hypothetical protein GCM10011617_00170 [Novosphingobium arvoryzae]